MSADRTGCVIVDCDVDTDQLVAFHRETKGLGEPAFIAIGGAEKTSSIPWVTTLPKPFLSADLLAALERIRLGSVPS